MVAIQSRRQKSEKKRRKRAYCLLWVSSLGALLVTFVAGVVRLEAVQRSWLLTENYYYSSSNVALQEHTPRQKLLRFDWTNFSPRSFIARELHMNQHNCTLPAKDIPWRVGAYGLGSDLHIWSNSLWAGLTFGHRVQSTSDWIWLDQEACKAFLSAQERPLSNSSLNCYFPNVEPYCPNNRVVRARSRDTFTGCGKGKYVSNISSIPDFRAATVEFAFSPVSSLVMQEAERQVRHVFGLAGVPENLIAVHVRWGDKVQETPHKNNPILHYVQAIEKIVQTNSLSSVHILLCTEDPEAVKKFEPHATSHNWTVYLDHFYTEYLPYRQAYGKIEYNMPSNIAVQTKGKAGLWALGSVLVAMEANYFILTTKSNWSRLINELRTNVVDPRCNNCTQMIDLAPYNKNC